MKNFDKINKNAETFYNELKNRIEKYKTIQNKSKEEYKILIEENNLFRNVESKIYSFFENYKIEKLENPDLDDNEYFKKLKKDEVEIIYKQQGYFKFKKWLDNFKFPNTEFENKNNYENSDETKIQWIGNKKDLVRLVYGIWYSNKITTTSGNAQITNVTNKLFEFFGIKDENIRVLLSQDKDVSDKSKTKIFQDLSEAYLKYRNEKDN